jgi:hypothetical protein
LEGKRPGWLVGGEERGGGNRTEVGEEDGDFGEGGDEDEEELIGHGDLEGG